MRVYFNLGYTYKYIWDVWLSYWAPSQPFRLVWGVRCSVAEFHFHISLLWLLHYQCLFTCVFAITYLPGMFLSSNILGDYWIKLFAMNSLCMGVAFPTQMFQSSVAGFLPGSTRGALYIGGNVIWLYLAKLQGGSAVPAQIYIIPKHSHIGAATKWPPFSRWHFTCIFLNENVLITIKISLKFVPTSPINNIPALVQILAWRRPGDNPLSEPMMVWLLTRICVTGPQWVNTRGKISAGHFLRDCHMRT